MEKTSVQSKRRIGLYWKILAVVGIVMVIGVVLAYVPGFGNRYAEKVYPKLYRVIAPVTNCFSFTLGEILMYAAAVIVAVTVVLLLIFGGIALYRKLRAKGPMTGGARFLRVYMKCFLAIVVLGLWLFIFHWWIPYHDYVLGVKEHRRAFTLEEIQTARNNIVKRLNETITKVPRGEDGKILYPDSSQRFAVIREALRGLAADYPRFEGYIAEPKSAICSDVLDWMNIGGFTYPYSMEATYNKYISDFYYYTLIAHEIAHNKGYYKENEAEFLGFLACYTSDDPLMVSAGCYYAFFDIDEYYVGVLYELYDEEKAWEIYNAQPKMSDLAVEDAVAAVEAAEEAYNADDHPLQEYSEVASDAADIGWETQAELIENNSYADVVYLIVEYFSDGKGR